MSSKSDDAIINEKTVAHDISELKDTVLAVDATYYITLALNNFSFHEPLLPALGGVMGIENQINAELDKWEPHGVKPFFIFDGQTVTGQDDVSTIQGVLANRETDKAWELYFSSRAEEAVVAFGKSFDAFQPQSLYPLLQQILRKRGLHFLVAPYNASAQMAYFEKYDSDMCSGIMGSKELLLYPINDTVIRSIDWDGKKVNAISKNALLRELNVTETVLIDALLMTGTSFLPPFPALQEPTLVSPQPYTTRDAVNLLRTTDKSIASACTSFNDILKQQDPKWLDKYQKARLLVHHFIYIAESGAIKVEHVETLTKDANEYLGLRLPAELFHYLNTGLIGGRLLSWLTHMKIFVLPTFDGVASTEYKQLVTSQLIPTVEMTLGLIVPRLHRGITFHDFIMKAWFAGQESFPTIKSSGIKSVASDKAATWDVKEQAIKQHFSSWGQGSSKDRSGSIAFEVLSLRNQDFVGATILPSSGKHIKGIKSADLITSIVTWRFLHLRGYVNDRHELTTWGKALAKTMDALKPTVNKHPDVPGLYEAALLAFELIRYDLLTNKRRHEELHGLPMHGTQEDKDNLLLISRCAVLLRLRHVPNGYTGPLCKNLLAFFSLADTIRDVDRNLVEAIVASMFLWAQCERHRDDYWELGNGLPFTNRHNNVALAIAVKTFFDEPVVDQTPEARAEHIKGFPERFVPYATHFGEDLEIFCAFFKALSAGVRATENELNDADKTMWAKAETYLSLRT